MRRHGPVIACCTDSEDFPKLTHLLISPQNAKLSPLILTFEAAWYTYFMHVYGIINSVTWQNGGSVEFVLFYNAHT